MILEHIWFEPFVYVGSVTGAGGGGGGAVQVQ